MPKNKNITQTYPTIFVIFGVTGDLSVQKLLPAIFSLYRANALPKSFALIGFSRREWSDEDFRKEVYDSFRKRGRNTRGLKVFLKKFYFQPGRFEDRESYHQLTEKIGKVSKRWGVCTNRLFHLSVSPDFYPLILKHLHKNKLTENCGPKEGWSRVLVEKPFGKDVRTAKKLDEFLATVLREDQIFRVDHYLAKETLQNILAFRFSNVLFEPIWNRRYIEKMHFRLLETGGIGSRGEFYDSIGALRDTGQNHLLQMLAAVTMDHPRRMDEKSIRKKRAKLLSKLEPIKKRDVLARVIRGQYIGYTSVKGVEKKSKTETYVRIEANIQSDRWNGVPFVLETGKALNERTAEIIVYFKEADPCFCTEKHKGHRHQNKLTFRIQPDEGISVRFWAKKPGLVQEIEKKNLSFLYRHKNGEPLNSYEKLLYDSMVGDQTLFSGTNEVLASWKFVTAILKGWKHLPLVKYKEGTGAFPLRKTN